MKSLNKDGWEAIESEGSERRESTGKRDKEIKCFSTRPVESFEVLNDLVVDRGPSPYVSLLELFGEFVFPFAELVVELTLVVERRRRAPHDDRPSRRADCFNAHGFDRLFGMWRFRAHAGVADGSHGAAFCRRLSRPSRGPSAPHHPYMPSHAFLPTDAFA